MITIGLVGKTNVGKTTFFNAATLLEKEVSTYPFTTKQPTSGIAYTKTICVCKELGVKCNPINSKCIDGYRFIPIKILDIPGLIKGSWKGKGLGNYFISTLAQSDAIIHIVDASGSIDADGKIGKPGIGDPIQDFYDIEQEIIRWLMQIIKRNIKDIVRSYKREGRTDAGLYNILSGLKLSYQDISNILIQNNLLYENPENWNEEELFLLASRIRKLKPTLIVANKMDLSTSEENYNRMLDELNEYIIIPCSTEAELALRRAVKSGLIEYIPGEEKFFVKNINRLSKKQRWALDYLTKRVLNKWLRTGVQQALDIVTFKLLSMNTVYPIADEKRYTDTKGNILPDVYLVPSGTKLKDLAEMIHTELAKGLLYGIDARTGVRLPKNYTIRDRDIIKLVSTTTRHT